MTLTLKLASSSSPSDSTLLLGCNSVSVGPRWSAILFSLLVPLPALNSISASSRLGHKKGLHNPFPIF